MENVNDGYTVKLPESIIVNSRRNGIYNNLPVGIELTLNREKNVYEFNSRVEENGENYRNVSVNRYWLNPQVVLRGIEDGTFSEIIPEFNKMQVAESKPEPFECESTIMDDREELEKVAKEMLVTSKPFKKRISPVREDWISELKFQLAQISSNVEQLLDVLDNIKTKYNV